MNQDQRSKDIYGGQAKARPIITPLESVLRFIMNIYITSKGWILLFPIGSETKSFKQQKKCQIFLIQTILEKDH